MWKWGGCFNKTSDTSVLMTNSQKILNKQMNIWEEALPLELLASHPNHPHQHPTIPVGMWESLKTILRNQLLKSVRRKPLFLLQNLLPARQYLPWSREFRTSKTPSRSRYDFGAWLNILGLGAKDLTRDMIASSSTPNDTALSPLQ